jgi:protein phosphatase PTC7
MRCLVRLAAVTILIPVVTSDDLRLGVQIGIGCKPKYEDIVETVEGSADIAKNCGEDAFYVSARKNYVSFGVADGVGGWANEGIDPSVFSNVLCTSARQAFLKADTPDPLDLMKQSYDNVTKGGDENVGSSTAVFLVLDRSTGRLKTANLGDSGYLIIRHGDVIFRSKAQTFGFNAPYQLSLYPSSSSMNERTDILNFKCEDSFVTSHTVQPGDVLILGSDGLFDNLFLDDILAEYESSLSHFYDKYPRYHTAMQAWWNAGLNESATHPPIMRKDYLKDLDKVMEDLSYCLTDLANDFANDDTVASPFSEEAQNAGYHMQGGKVDDITVVAVYVYASSTLHMHAVPTSTTPPSTRQ